MKKCILILCMMNLVLPIGFAAYASDNATYIMSEQSSLESSYIYNTNLSTLPTPVNAPTNDTTNNIFNNSDIIPINIQTSNNSSTNNLNIYERLMETPLNTPIGSQIFAFNHSNNSTPNITIGNQIFAFNNFNSSISSAHDITPGTPLSTPVDASIR